MSRKGQSLFLLALVVMMLAGCSRIGGLLGGRPTPTAVSTAVVIASPLPATAAATSTVATAAPLVTLTNTPTPSPTAIPPTAAPNTATAAPPTATPAPPTATAVPPTATPNQGPPPGGQARITFAPGATSAVVQSTLAARGDTDNWVMYVLAGQVISVQTISSAPGAINVQLLDANGGLLASNPDTAGISAVVPATGDYQIVFSTPNAAPQVSYTAQVFIPPVAGPVAPTRIQFAPGASLAQLNDSLMAGGDLNQYVLQLAANQQVSVAVFASVPAVTNIIIRNSAGQQIAAGTDMSGVAATTTAAGDYFIDISSAAAAPAVNYMLTVSAPPPPTNQPVRIAFGPGQTSQGFDVTLSAGTTLRYVIALSAGQMLLTNVSDTPPASMDITVQDAAGNVLNFGRGPTELGTLVAASGDYFITLSTSAATSNAALVVTAPPLPGSNATRIIFDAGASSAVVTGDLAFGGDVDTWVLAASAGQTMSVSLGSNQPGWSAVYIYDQGGNLIGLGSDMETVAAPLALGGDYRIVIVSDAAAGPIGYTMTVMVE